VGAAAAVRTGFVYMLDRMAATACRENPLTAFATDWLRSAGMRAAMVETGGDAGHVAARRLYEAAGYTPLPAIRYFRAL
jgi:hypothetical protein